MTSSEIGVDLSNYQLGWSDEEDYVYKPKKGLNADIIKEMSGMKNEPQWMHDFRMKSYERFLTILFNADFEILYKILPNFLLCLRFPLILIEPARDEKKIILVFLMSFFFFIISSINFN